jgi:hypothetical protein
MRWTARHPRPPRVSALSCSLRCILECFVVRHNSCNAEPDKSDTRPLEGTSRPRNAEGAIPPIGSCGHSAAVGSFTTM